jgi:hypothetical protein
MLFSIALTQLRKKVLKNSYAKGVNFFPVTDAACEIS